MNKKAQPNDPFTLIISALVGLIFLGFLAVIIPSLTCQSEKAQVEQLSGDLSICQSKIQNQTILTQTLNKQCDQRVNQSVQECNDDLNTNILIVKSYKQVFIIYHISIIFSLVFGITLFKFAFKWKIQAQTKKMRRFLKIIKVAWIVVWILLTLFFIGAILLSIGYLLFPHWFY